MGQPKAGPLGIRANLGLNDSIPSGLENGPLRRTAERVILIPWKTSRNLNKSLFVWNSRITLSKYVGTAVLVAVAVRLMKCVPSASLSVMSDSKNGMVHPCFCAAGHCARINLFRRLGAFVSLFCSSYQPGSRSRTTPRLQHQRCWGEQGNHQWGLDTTWVNSDNVQRGLIFMGTNK